VTHGVLVLGGTGRLGHAVAAELARRGRRYDAPPRAAFDVADLDGMHGLLAAFAPAAVINAAGFTDVAAAELATNGPSVKRLNAEAPAVLARFCADREIPFVHLSTDYVFDGAKGVAYLEDDPVHPLQEYGRSKLAGERAVLAAASSALIIRVSTLYGPSARGRPAYVDAIRAQAAERAAQGGGALEVVEHPVSSPTLAVDVAPALLDLVDEGAAGIVHVVNSGAASRLELARATVALAGFADRVEVRTRPEPAGTLARPAYSVLDTAKLKRLIGRRLPDWRDALQRYMEHTGVAR